MPAAIVREVSEEITNNRDDIDKNTMKKCCLNLKAIFVIKILTVSMAFYLPRAIPVIYQLDTRSIPVLSGTINIQKWLL